MVTVFEVRLISTREIPALGNRAFIYFRMRTSSSRPAAKDLPANQVERQFLLICSLYPTGCVFDPKVLLNFSRRIRRLLNGLLVYLIWKCVP